MYTLQIFESIFNKINDVGLKILYYNVLSLVGIRDVQFPLVMFVLLVGCVWFMLRLCFINITQLVPSFRFLLKGTGSSSKGSGEDGQISSLKALFSVVAGSTGLGAIVGTISAISVAGPGVVFWIFLTPLIGMPMKFAEVFVGHKYRAKVGGVWTGGPSRYLKDGLTEAGFPRLATLFALLYSVFVMFGSLSGGSSYQANQVTTIVTQTFPLLVGKEMIVSICFASFIAFVILGNAKKISSVLAFAAPITVGSYFVCSFAVLWSNYTKIIPSLLLIIHSAFDTKVAFTGLFASFIIGFCRTVMATETGLGTAAAMHATSGNESSVKEGILSMSSSVIVAVCVCVMSSLVVIVTGSYTSGNVGVVLLTDAFSTVSPKLALIVMIIVPVMASNVAIAWSLYGARSMEYVAGPKLVIVYKLVFIAFVFGGGIMTDFMTLLKFADVAITSIVLPNVIGIMLMSGMIAKSYKDYLSGK